MSADWTPTEEDWYEATGYTVLDWQRWYDTEAEARAAWNRWLNSVRAEAWDEGWSAAQEVVDFEGEKVWAHQVLPEGYEGNPYQKGADR